MKYEMWLLRWRTAYALVMGFSMVLLLATNEILLGFFALFHFLYAIELMEHGLARRLLRGAIIRMSGE